MKPKFRILKEITQNRINNLQCAKTYPFKSSFKRDVRIDKIIHKLINRG